MPSKEILDYDGTNLKIKEFKLSMLKDHAAIAMIAKRGSGKSIVCRDILREKGDIPGGMIIAPTDKMNSFYGDFIPQLYIHYEFRPELLETLLYRQELMIEKAAEKAKKGKKVDPRAFLLMDDCMAKKSSWIKDDTISEIFMNGRHYKLTYMLTMQYSLGISPELRSNFDYVFLLADDFRSNKERIWKHYAGMFPTFDSFCTVFDELTDNYGCMVIDNKVKSKKISEKIFWYKSDCKEHVPKMGCKQYRKYHRKNYDPNWKKRNKRTQFDINNMMGRRRNKPSFSVEKI